MKFSATKISDGSKSFFNWRRGEILSLVWVDGEVLPLSSGSIEGNPLVALIRRGSKVTAIKLNPSCHLDKNDNQFVTIKSGQCIQIGVQLYRLEWSGILF